MIDAHRGAFEYDWRTRFNLPISAVGTKRMSWGEALRMTYVLVADTSSQVAASLAGWKYPVAREALALMDQFDFHWRVIWERGGRKGSAPQPYPRPWPEATSRRSKPDESLTQDEIIAALRAAGHTAPLP